MSDLSTLLASIGETCSERPDWIDDGWEHAHISKVSLAQIVGTDDTPPASRVQELHAYARALEQTLARVAGRLAEAERNTDLAQPKVTGEAACKTCCGYGSYLMFKRRETGGDDEGDYVVCERCSGTGRTGAQP